MAHWPAIYILQVVLRLFTCSKTIHILRSWGGKKNQVLGFLQPISKLHGHKGGVIPPKEIRMLLPEQWTLDTQ